MIKICRLKQATEYIPICSIILGKIKQKQTHTLNTNMPLRSIHYLLVFLAWVVDFLAK